MKKSQFSVSHQLNKTKNKQISIIALGLESLIFLLSIVPVQQVDVIFGSALEYQLANMNSIDIIPLSLSIWRSVAIIVQSYWLFALVCFSESLALHIRNSYRVATIFGLLPLIGVFLLFVLEGIGGVRLP